MYRRIIIIKKAFITANGRELQEGQDISDHWYEFEDSNDDLHYGR